MYPEGGGLGKAFEGVSGWNLASLDEPQIPLAGRFRRRIHSPLSGWQEYGDAIHDLVRHFTPDFPGYR